MYTCTSVISTFPTAGEQSTNSMRLANADIRRLDDYKEIHVTLYN